MPALTAADVTLSIAPRYARQTDQGLRRVSGTLTFGNGTLTYPTGGVPLPAIGNFGFRAAVSTFIVFGNNALATDYGVAYNPAAHALLLYQSAASAGTPHPEADTLEAPAARTYSFMASGF